MAPNVVIPYFTVLHCHMHHIATDKEPVLISICIQYMKCSLFILIDVICYCLHTKSVIMKFKSDIYIYLKDCIVKTLNFEKNH